MNILTGRLEYLFFGVTYIDFRGPIDPGRGIHSRGPGFLRVKLRFLCENGKEINLIGGRLVCSLIGASPHRSGLAGVKLSPDFGSLK